MEPSNDVALDIIITNVVSVFRTRCHLNLRTIGLEGNNVIYRPEVGVRDEFQESNCCRVKIETGQQMGVELGRSVV